MRTVAIGEARAACAQNFAPRQQATIEFTGRDRSPCTLVVTFNHSQASIGRAFTPWSLYYCLFEPRIYIVVLRAHPVHGESHIQRNATGEFATTSSPLFTTNRTNLTSFSEGFTRHNLHILVTGTAPFFCNQKSPSGMYTKLHTTAASNNRIHVLRSLSAYARDEQTVIYCDPDPVLNFQKSVQVQPQSKLFKKLKAQVQIKSKN